MRVIQNVLYGITEWDGVRNYVHVKCVGGDILMRYQDGAVHRVTLAYFKALNPAVTVPFPTYENC